MCNPASFVLTKDRVFWSKTSDSHEEIIRENSLFESVAGNPCIVRVEITPPDNEFQKPESEWAFRVDQDVLPEWFDREEAEKSVRLELKAWIKSKIVRAGESRDVNAGDLVLFVLSNGVVQNVWGNGVVQDVWGNGVAIVYNSSAGSVVVHGERAVLVDRSGDKSVCRVGC